MRRRCRPAMGTFVEISVDDAPATGVDAAFATAFAAIDRVAARMSFHDPASDLSRLHASATAHPVPVDPWTFDVLQLARRFFLATDGLFDCSVGAELVECGVLPRAGNSCRLHGGSLADVVLHDDGRVAFTRPLCLDLGGIAKGYAVDRAIDALRAAGIRHAVVNAGGDLRVLGDRPVPIHVRRLDGRGLVAAGSLADGAFATSGAGRPDRRSPRQSRSAIVDPRDRRIVDDRRLHSVIAPTCVVADALTKVAAVSGTLSPSVCATFGATHVLH